MSQEIIEKTFKVSTPAKLTVSNIRGSVEIYPGDDDTIQVTASIDLKSGDSERTEVTTTPEGENQVTVKTKYQEGWFGFPSSKPCKPEPLLCHGQTGDHHLCGN